MAYESYLDAAALREHARVVVDRPSLEGATPIGDINDDGFVDFARINAQGFEPLRLSHVEVAFGTDEGLPTDAFEEFNGTTGFIVEPFLDQPGIARGFEFGIDLAGGVVARR